MAKRLAREVLKKTSSSETVLHRTQTPGVFFVPIEGADNILSIAFTAPVREARVMIGSVHWLLPLTRDNSKIRLGKDKPFPLVGVRTDRMVVEYVAERREEVALIVEFGIYTEAEYEAFRGIIPQLVQINHSVPIVFALVGGDYFPVSAEKMLVPCVEYLFYDNMIDAETRDFLYDQILKRRKELMARRRK